MSLPTRECGLKSIAVTILVIWYLVTPYAGVWIEIIKMSADPSNKLVTPYAGVWIEIESIGQNQTGGNESLPTRECGLKYCRYGGQVDVLESLPTRECGLKFKVKRIILLKLESLPTRECGLKSRDLS